MLASQVRALVDGGVGDVFHDLVDQVVGLLALVADSEALDHVGETHHTEADGTVLLVGEVRLLNRRAGDVDEVVELPNRRGSRPR